MANAVTSLNRVTSAPVLPGPLRKPALSVASNGSILNFANKGFAGMEGKTSGEGPTSFSGSPSFSSSPSSATVRTEGNVFRRTLKGWESCAMKLKSNEVVFFPVFTSVHPSPSSASSVDSPGLAPIVFTQGAVVQVLWAYEEKTGQKFQFFLTDVKQVKHYFQIFNMNEFEGWLSAFQSFGCVLKRPIKLDTMRLFKERQDGWGVLYSDFLFYYRKITDNSPAQMISIGEGSVVEGYDNEFYGLLSNDQANTIVFSGREWIEIIITAVNRKHSRKFSDSLYEGSLMKSGKNMGWKRRYCVLMIDHIKCFKTRFQDKPSTIIKLPPGADAEGLPASDQIRKHQFWVGANGDASGTRRYKLAAPTEQEKEQWLRSLFHLFNTKDNRVNLLSIKEGYLYKNSSKGLWTKKYFVLLQGALFYVSNRNDFLNTDLIDFKSNYVDTKKIGYINLVNSPDLLPVVSLDTIAIAEHGDEGTRTCVLRAPNRQVQQEWITEIQSLLRQHDVLLSSQSLKEGFLRNQTKKRKQWHRGYFVLLQNNFLYFRNRSDEKATIEITITATTDLAQISGDPHNPFLFTLSEPGGDENSSVNYFYTFSCESEEVRLSWMTHLATNIKAKNVKLFPDSKFEGYMFKKQSRAPENPGQRRYFVLKDNTLMYYKNKSDITKPRVLEIKGECEIIVIDTGDFPFMFSVAQSGDEGEKVIKLYCRDSTTRTEWIDVLKEQIARFPLTKIKPNSLREGYVYLRRDDTWRKRFFILDFDSFSLFPKKAERKAELIFPLEEDTYVALLDQGTPAGVWGHLDTSERCPPPDFVSWRELDIQRQYRDDSLLAFVDNTVPDPSGNFQGFQLERQDEELKSLLEDGLQMVMCNNSDAEKKNIRLKNVDEVLACKMSEICLQKEFLLPRTNVVKSGDLIVAHTAVKLDPWRTSFVTLTKEKLMIEQNRRGQVLLVIAFSSHSQLLTDATGQIHIFDSIRQETLTIKPQTDDENVSWIGAIETCLSNFPIRLVELFGSDLKTSVQHSAFYRLPSVITPCIEFLKTCRSSICLLKQPGFHPRVRSLIQDFERCGGGGGGNIVPLSHPESVAACLKLYLVMLCDPIISDSVAKSLMITISASENANLSNVQELLATIENNCATCLNLILYYLKGEVDRGSVNLEDVISSWGPLLMKSFYKGEGSANPVASAVLRVLIQNVSFLFPYIPVPVRKLSQSELHPIRSEYMATRFENFRKSSFGMGLFTQWTKDNLLPENVAFLNAVQQYRQMCKSPVHSQAECLDAALLICATHIRPGADQQVNISADLAQSVLSVFEQSNATWCGEEFSPIEAEVHVLIVTNEYVRFQKTELFEEWIAFRHAMKAPATSVTTTSNAITVAASSPAQKGLLQQAQAFERGSCLDPATGQEIIPVPLSGLLDSRLKSSNSSTSSGTLLSAPRGSIQNNRIVHHFTYSSPFLYQPNVHGDGSVSGANGFSYGEAKHGEDNDSEEIKTDDFGKPLATLERSQTMSTFSSIKAKPSRFRRPW